MRFVCFLLSLYSLAVLLWVILSWVRISSVHPLARVVTFLDRIIYPLVLPLRRVLPPLRIGPGLLDLSPLVLILGLSLIRNVIC